MHKLLSRQLRRHFGARQLPAELDAFLADVDAAYRQADADRTLLERSLELTSQELMQRNATLRSFLDSAPFILGVVDLEENDLRYVSLNRATERLWGLPPEAAEGKRASEIGVPRTEIDRRMAQYRLAEATQRPVQAGYERTTREGTRWHLYTVARIGGAPNRFCLLVEDATDRRRAEAALEASEATIRSFFEAAPFIIGIVEEVGDDVRIVSANRTAAEQLGCTTEAIVGRLRSQLGLSEETIARSRRAEQRCRATGRPVHIEFEHTGATGVRCLQSTIAPLATAPGKPARFCFIIDDATDRVQLQRKLSLSSRLASVGTLAAGVAHEINNPLAYVVANLAVAIEDLRSLRASGVAGLEPILESLIDAQHGGERIRRIVRDLKIFSRGDDDSAVATAVDLRKVLESSIAIAANEIRHRAQLAFEFAPIPLVDAHESKLGQLFLNLLVNAAQAIRDGAAEANQIVVSTRTNESGWAVIEIRDTGCGIAPELREKIFDPFFTTKSVGEGTGLGLAICHSIVADAGGSIAVESALGEGSVFRVELPPSRARTAPAIAAPAAPACALSRRVLVIDDEPIIGAVVRRILRTHEVVVSTRAREALAAIESGERFDLVLCDLMMPEMSGIALHHELMRVDRAVAERMVFFTGGAFTAEARAFLDRVPNRCIDKPFAVAELHALVAAAAGAPLAQQKLA